MNINVLKMELENEENIQDNISFKDSLIYKMSDQEIKEKFKDIFSDIFLDNWRDIEISIDKDDKYINVNVYQMYEFINLKAEHLVNMCQVFKTDRIKIEEDSRSGCETCDYGSEYTRSFKFY